MNYETCIKCAMCSDFGMIEEERMANICSHCEVGIQYKMYKCEFQYKRNKYKGVTYNWWSVFDKQEEFATCIYRRKNGKWEECFHTSFGYDFFSKKDMKDTVKLTEKLIEKYGQSATTDQE